LTQKAADDAEVAAGSVHTVAVDYDASSRPLAVSSVVDAVGATLPFERLQRLREALRQVAAEAPQVCARVRQGLGESRRTSGVLYMLLGDPATEAVIAEVHTARQNKIIARLLSFVLSQALAHCAGSRSPRWRRSSATSLLCQQTGAWPSLAARSPSTCRRCSHLSVGREYVLLPRLCIVSCVLDWVLSRNSPADAHLSAYLNAGPDACPEAPRAADDRRRQRPHTTARIRRHCAAELQRRRQSAQRCSLGLQIRGQVAAHPLCRAS